MADTPEEDGIIPAYAGSTATTMATCANSMDHPRIRGEHRLSGLYTGDGQGSSPHTRGAQPGQGVRYGSIGIIPAYAGSTPASTGRPNGPRDHPRIRGEHEPSLPAPARPTGSSPHTRGARAWSARPARPAGIIPAYAGSTAACAWTTPPTWDHPRIRGEHGLALVVAGAVAGSSPHTRGALIRGAGRVVGDRIIPAYAGSTHVAARRGRI